MPIMPTSGVLKKLVFFKKFLEDINTLCGATDTSVLDLSDFFSGFQNQSGQPYSPMAEVYMLYFP